METFKNDEAGYRDWRNDHPDGYVFNHFGGTDAANNVLHRSTCRFLSREKDEGARTVYEKWCSEDEQELANHANTTLATGMWHRCTACYPETSTG
jgi:hypothetical protein